MTTINTTDAAAAFKNLVNLLAVFSEATARLTEFQAELDKSTLDLIDEHKTTYAELQRTLTEAETALEVICLAHTEWFTEKQTLKTPYGSVAFRRSTKLQVANEELTIALIQKAEAANGEATGLLRETVELDLEALEKFDDTALKLFRVTRLHNTGFSVKPAKIDLGKAVKEAAEATAA